MASEMKAGKTDAKKVSSKEKAQSVLETHGFSVIETVGHGSYASVKSAYSNKHKCNVAIKVVSKRKAPEDYLLKFLPRDTL